MKKAPTWLRVMAAIIIVVSGTVSLIANYVTIRDYLEKNKNASSNP